MKEIARQLELPAVPGFSFFIDINEIDRRSEDRKSGQHIHDRYEICFSLGGKAGFMVGDRIYPLEKGEAVLIPPHVYHHCIFFDENPYRNVWILLDEAPIRTFFPILLKKDASPFLSPDEKSKRELISLCESLPFAEPAAQYGQVLKLLFLLSDSVSKSADEPLGEALPASLHAALSFFRVHFREPISVKEVAASLFMSQSTLERQCKLYLGITPKKYLEHLKMDYASELLADGCDVSEAAARSGFGDDSHFIAVFHSIYGITPKQYARKYRK
ncbi:MAG: AraC family transcriptional regulator [Clostridia bacterium]|nr:AraC family transcriptional regulator [Clostridia bacterium]